jgi:hypothetical protein
MPGIRLLLALVLLAAAMPAADVAGAWSGVIDVDDPAGGNKIPTPVRLVLEQQGSTVTGRIGRAQDENLEAIRNGRLEGAKLTFEVVSAEAKANVRFALTLDGGKLDGAMQGTLDTGPISGAVHLSRAGRQ